VQADASEEVRGSAGVADTFSGPARAAQLALVNGSVGAVWAPGGRPRVVFRFTTTDRKIAEIELIADPERVLQLAPVVIDD
jgi:RNA polymerase sigma-70 factor (ECF subfamily)